MMKQNLLHAFVGAVFLALSMPMQAEGVKWLAKCLETSKITVNRGTTTIDGNTLKIAGTTNQEIKLTLTPGQAMAMNNGQTFVVIEANTTFDNTKKLDHLTVEDGTQLVNKSGSLLGFNKEVNGHKLTVFNILDKRGTNKSDVEAVDEIIQYLSDNESISASEASFYLKPNTALANDAAIEIYNVGFYTLGDILTEYPSLAGSNGWRFTKSNLCEMESFTGNGVNTVRVNNATDATTVKYNYLRARTLQGMPRAYTNLDLRNMKLANDETAAINKDAFAGLFFNKILMDNTQYKLFPTMNSAVCAAGYRHYAYKDGVAPSGVKEAVDGGGSKGKLYSYTRNFKTGNNSSVLPFDVNASDLEALGLKAYTFESYANGNANFVSATGVIAAGTPMLIKAEKEGLYLIPAAETPNLWSDISGYKDVTDASGNKFVGSFEYEVPSSYSNCFGLDVSASSFMKMGTDVKATYYRAFLSLAGIQAASAVTFSLDGNSSTTGISNVQKVQKEDGAYYNLQGVKMNPSNLPHGIYIHNGKKIVK
jgi:hypothetical protein